MARLFLADYPSNMYPQLQIPAYVSFTTSLVARVSLQRRNTCAESIPTNLSSCRRKILGLANGTFRYIFTSEPICHASYLDLH